MMTVSIHIPYSIWHHYLLPEIVAVADHNSNLLIETIILESKICPNTTYQKQQDTLICWSENEQELALSFQLIDSCSEIWEKICDVCIIIVIYLSLILTVIPVWHC